MRSPWQSGETARPTIRELRRFGGLLSCAVLFWTVVGHCAGRWPACWELLLSERDFDAAVPDLASRIALLVSGLLLALSVLWPRALTPLHRVMRRIGRGLHSLISRVALLALFFLVVTPMSVFLRLLRRDPLRLRFDPAATSYWVDRADDGFTRERFRDPF